MKNCLGKELYDLLRDLEDLPIFLRVSSWGDEGPMSLEAVDASGDVIDETCPLLEVTKRGEFVEQGLVNDDRTPVQILRDALNGGREKQINIRLTAKELAALKKEAGRRSVSEIVRRRLGLS